MEVKDLACLLPGKSVDSVVSTFTKAINDLDAIAERESTKQTTINDKMKKLEKAKEASALEASRAAKICSNIKGLLDV